MLYAAKEPFGEVRRDMRMAKLLQFYYESNRGKHGKASTLGQFMLYPDFWPEADEIVDVASEQALLRAIGGLRG